MEFPQTPPPHACISKEEGVYMRDLILIKFHFFTKWVKIWTVDQITYVTGFVETSCALSIFYENVEIRLISTKSNI
jgi:hypothetical protein